MQTLSMKKTKVKKEPVVWNFLRDPKKKKEIFKPRFTKEVK